MSWLDGLRRSRDSEPDPPVQEPAPAPGIERGSPGIEALFTGLKEGGSLAILDMGSALPENLRLYSRYARRIRFADFLIDPPRGLHFEKALHALEPPAGGFFHLVMVWNLLDLMTPEERVSLMSRLDGITTRGSRIYVAVDASDTGQVQPLKFTLLAPGRVRQEPVGPLRPVSSPLLPAEVERLLRPFEVSRAFTLRLGLREYLGVKEGEALRQSAWDLG